MNSGRLEKPFKYTGVPRRISQTAAGRQACKLPVLLTPHSIINKVSKPAWLKDLASIDMGLYRRFYRQDRRAFAGAGDGAICGAATLATPSSINNKDTQDRGSCPHFETFERPSTVSRCSFAALSCSSVIELYTFAWDNPPAFRRRFDWALIRSFLAGQQCQSGQRRGIAPCVQRSAAVAALLRC